MLLAVSSGAQDYHWLPHQCLPWAYVDEFDRDLFLPAVGTGMEDKCCTFTDTRAIDLFNVPLHLPLRGSKFARFLHPTRGKLSVEIPLSAIFSLPTESNFSDNR